jgi:hypothetical protein
MNDRIHELVERALELARNDVLVAIKILREFGISEAAAVDAVDRLVTEHPRDSVSEGELK